MDYAPQWTLTLPSNPWKADDVNRPYPLLSRPSTVAVVARLRTDSGNDAGDAPEYVTTQYMYGKPVYDVRRGASLGIDRRYTQQSASTPSGMVNTVALERYDTEPVYDEDKKAYPLTGSLLSSSMTWGEAGEAMQLTHAGHAYSSHEGIVPGILAMEDAMRMATVAAVSLAAFTAMASPIAFGAARVWHIRGSILSSKRAWWKIFTTWDYVVSREPFPSISHRSLT